MTRKNYSMFFRSISVVSVFQNVNNYEYKTAYGAKPGEALVHTAEEVKADMVIMGTRGLGTIRRTIMGSVSDYVVHHAHCPVIVCRH